MAPIVDDLTGGLMAQAGPYVLFVAAALAVTGAVFWLAGARFGEYATCLAGVAAGTLIGLQAPRWFELPVSNLATATAGALAGGLVGYLGHRAVVGAALACLLALWTAAGVAVAWGVGAAVPIPRRETQAAMWQYLSQVWQALPGDIRRAAPFACALAASAGLALAILSGRLATYLFFSLLGVTLLLAAAHAGRPQLLAILPSRPALQLAVLLAAVSFGMLAQWRGRTPRAGAGAGRAPAPKAPSK